MNIILHDNFILSILTIFSTCAYYCARFFVLKPHQKSSPALPNDELTIPKLYEVSLFYFSKQFLHKCPMHGGTKTGAFPEKIKATVQYGKNLQAMVVAINTVGTVIINHAHKYCPVYLTFHWQQEPSKTR